MRDHMGLFRGKLLDDDEWMCGFLCCESSTEVCVSDSYGWNPVNPDTVGECTGLKDRNEKLIFEGDILKYQMNDGSLSDWLAVVRFGAYNCTCCDGVYGWYLDGGYGDIRDFEDCEDAGPYVIVGNIHDNPDLIGGNDA